MCVYVCIYRHIRPYLTTEAAKLFMDAMIFSNISYCFTNWSQANVTTLKPIETLYKQTLKILDQKPISYHHCNIIIKYNLFNFDSFLLDACLIFNIWHGLAPPPLGEFIQQKSSSGRATRAATRGDCVVPYRRSKFGQKSSQYGLQIIGTVSLLNSERAPAIYHLNLHLRNGLKTLKPAIIISWFTLS